MAKSALDKQVLALQAEVDAKKKALGSAVGHIPKTNMVLELYGKSYNLNVADRGTLLMLIGTLVPIDVSIAQEFPGEDPTFGGYPVRDWLADIRAKYINLNRKTEQARLDKLQAELDELLSHDAKVSRKLENLKNLI